MNEQQILDNWGRKGWRVTARRPQLDPVTREDTGNVVWSIMGPNGEPDEVVVKQTRAASAGVPSPGSTDPSQPPSGAQYEPIEGPSKALPTTRTQTPQGWTEIQWIDPDGKGTETAYGRDPADGRIKQVPGVPQRVKGQTSTARPVTATKDLDLIPDPTTGKPIAYRDPSTGATIPIAQGGQKKTGTEDTIQGGTLYHWRYDEQGNPHLAGSETAPDPTRVPDGTATYIAAAGGWGIPAVYRNGQPMPTGGTAIALTPAAVAPDAKPTEGAYRDNVIQGQKVRQVYRGGEWVVDPSVQPTPYGPQTDPSQETKRLQAMAQAERDRINAQPISDEAKRAAFDDWWATNIEPSRAALQQKQDQQNLSDSRDVLSTVNSGAQTGSSILNQRVASGTGLLNNLTSLAGNSKITAVPTGLGGQLVSGVQDWVTQMGGGQDVYNAAAEMVHQANPSLKGTTLGAQASAAIGQILDRQQQQRISDGFGSYTPGAQPNANAVGALNPARYTFSGGGQPGLPAPQQPPQPTITINVGNAPISGPQATDDPYGRLNARI